MWEVFGLKVGDGKSARHRESVDHLDQRIFRVNFADMQRIHLRKLQVRLVTHAVHMHERKSEPEADWEQDLADYSTPLTFSPFLVSQADS